MAFTKKIPEWNASGVEPPQSLKDSGWKPGVKPAADHFNWLQTTASEAIKELQQKAGEVKKVNGQLPDANGNVNVNIDTSKLATKEELSSASTYIQQEMDDLEQTVGAHQADFVNLAIGKKTILNVTSDFKNKVPGSVVENPNKAAADTKSTSQIPSSTTWNEFSEYYYGTVSALDGTVRPTNTSVSSYISQQLFSFNIIEILTRKYGVEIFGGATTLAEKVAKAKTIIINLACNWLGYGSGPTGNKATLRIFNVQLNNWAQYDGANNVSSTVAMIKYPVSSSVLVNCIDNNGFVHFLAYAEPSDGTVPSIINTDYVSLDITASVSALADVKKDFNAHKADYVQHPGTGTTTNSGNAYTVTLNPAPTSYVDKMGLILTINADSTGTSTINVNGLGAKPVKKANGTDVTNLKAGGIYSLRYNTATGNFILQGEGGAGNATASDLLSGKTASTDAGDIVGTMPNRGIFNLALGATVPAGYYSGGIVPNGKKWASGTVTSSSDLDTKNFTYFNNTGTTSLSYVVISGLNFIPSKINLNRIDTGTGNMYESIYEYIPSLSHPYLVRLISYNYVSQVSQYMKYFEANVSPAYVNGTGFLLPVIRNSEVYNWTAVE